MTLQALGMTQADLSQKTGRALQTINEIVNGKISITPETALQLERVLRVDASFWNGLEIRHQDLAVRRRDRERLVKYVRWVERFPLGELVVRGWLTPTDDKIEMVEQLLVLFGVSNPSVWNDIWLNAAQLQRNEAFKTAPYAIASWMRIGEILARRIVCKPFDKIDLRTALESVRSLTNAPISTIKSELVERFCQAGVALTFVAPFSGVAVRVATQWIDAEKALLHLSCQYDSDVQFWQALYEGIGHILLHGKKEVFIRSNYGGYHEPEDRSIKEFAARSLLNPQQVQHILNHWREEESFIAKIASKLSIAPGIIVDQLQSLGCLSHTKLNQLKRSPFELSEDS